jgi:signal transduction histidine kinase
MRWHSLRLRLIAGGLAAILIALTIAGIALTFLFERHVARTLADDLDVHLKQLLAGLDVDPQNGLVVTKPPVDPRFSDPLSGLYWQIGDDRGQLLRSRSLWDSTLPLARDEPSAGEVHRHETRGPADARVLVAERQVTLTIGDRRVPVRVAVAADLARVSAAAMSFAKDLAGALALLGVVLAAATSIQVALGLRPLVALRRGIADIRSGRSRRLPNAVPVEVRPLVEEVNAMLDTQEREISRSRGRAADLAHGLKTPLAALAADIGRLRERGESGIASDIEALSDAMTRHVDRELAKARLHGGVRHGLSTELAPLVRSLVATLVRTPAGADISFEPHVSDSLLVPFDRTDLAEVLGNLLENATRHAASCVRVTASPSPAGVSIAIEDDGRGIAPIARSKVLERGVRLDQRGDGTGLGLAIVQELLDAYGWQLDLASSELGGLKVTIAPRSASVEPSKTGLDFAASKVLPANLTPR